MKTVFKVMIFGLIAATQLAAAAEVVLSDDGREVRLNADGTWEFVSNDRYATTQSGERIRLGADGRWEPVEDASAWQTVTRVQPTTDSVDGLSVGDFVIEAVRSTQHKNKRVRSQMVIDILMQTEAGGGSGLSPSEVRVEDSKGRRYDIKTVRATGSGLQVIADDAPRWFGVKYFEIALPGALAGKSGQIVLRKRFADVDKRDVESLTP